MDLSIKSGARTGQTLLETDELRSASSIGWKNFSMKQAIFEHSTARGLRVCVCTSYRADAEPRAPRHAKAISALDEVADVVFLECAPYGERRSELPDFANHPKLRSTVHW